ncbi:hypothetical protein F5Y16DRAFT_1920 [Xylariaceae sp. FL0255]|nr:hypothetical protein F5Y16DRAFT_1920 [Xylariaceae sp. FL0255]
MKLLAAIPAFLAAVAFADDELVWQNIPPVDASYTIGTDFVLEWTPEKKSTDTFSLTIGAWNSTPEYYTTGPYGSQIPVYDTKEITLSDAVPFSAGNYTWEIKTLDDAGVWTGEQFCYSFTATWNGGFESSSPRAFHIVNP